MRCLSPSASMQIHVPWAPLHVIYVDIFIPNVIRRASFIATKAPFAPGRRVASEGSQALQTQAATLLTSLGSPELLAALVTASGGFQLQDPPRPPESGSVTGGRYSRKWAAEVGLVKGSGFRAGWRAPPPPPSGTGTPPCSRSAPVPAQPGWHACQARRALHRPLPLTYYNDDASGSCATSSLSSPLWPHTVRSKVKSRPAGLDFSVEGLLCVSFFIQ